MIVLDRQPFLDLLVKRGYASLGDFCNAIGVHRNSLGRYLSGAPVLPGVIEKAFGALKTSSLGLLRERSRPMSPDIDDSLALLVGSLVLKKPTCAVVLFGSRAKQTAHKYSDIDLGIIEQGPIELQELSALQEIVDEHGQNFPYKIDLVDLRRTTPEFIQEVGQTYRLLGGNPMQLSIFRSGDEQRSR